MTSCTDPAQVASSARSPHVIVFIHAPPWSFRDHPVQGSKRSFEKLLTSVLGELARLRRPWLVPPGHEGLGRRDVADVFVGEFHEPGELVGGGLLDAKSVLDEVLRSVGGDAERADAQTLDLAL